MSFSLQLLSVPAFFSIGALGMLIAAHNDALVAGREHWVMGVIASHEPQNHNRFGYRFQVEGINYSGWVTPPKEEPKIGQSVRVYFDSLDPAENALTDFAELADTRRGQAIVLLIMCGFFAAAVAFLGRTIGKREAKI